MYSVTKTENRGNIFYIFMTNEYKRIKQFIFSFYIEWRNQKVNTEANNYERKTKSIISEAFN